MNPKKEIVEPAERQVSKRLIKDGKNDKPPTMTKPRKLHPLKGTITYACLGKVTSKGPHQDQPFYLLTIQLESLFTGKKEASIYVFPNLVNKEI